MNQTLQNIIPFIFSTVIPSFAHIHLDNRSTKSEMKNNFIFSTTTHFLASVGFPEIEMAYFYFFNTQLWTNMCCAQPRFARKPG